MAIAPGSTVTIEITHTPRCQAAQKTLRRLCAKDRAVAKLQRYRKRHRPSWEEWRRGAMTWHHQMRSRPAVDLASGASYTVKATLDVLRDLESVADCVKVSPA